MLLSNKIAGFFDCQYLWKETIKVIVFSTEVATKEG